MRSHFYPDLCVLADVRDQRALSAALQGCEVVINLAAGHKDNVNRSVFADEVNVDGAKNALLLNANIKRIIFTEARLLYMVCTFGYTDEDGLFCAIQSLRKN